MEYSERKGREESVLMPDQRGHMDTKKFKKINKNLLNVFVIV